MKNLINRALKLVLNIPIVSTEICKNKNIFDYDMAYNYFCSINMFRILRLNHHPFLANKVQLYQRSHSHHTRSVQNQVLNLPKPNCSKFQRSFLYNGIQIWNNLPLNIRNVQDDLHSFKYRLKQFLLS